MSEIQHSRKPRQHSVLTGEMPKILFEIQFCLYSCKYGVNILSIIDNLTDNVLVLCYVPQPADEFKKVWLTV